jgi:hypothetical protein
MFGGSLFQGSYTSIFITYSWFLTHKCCIYNSSLLHNCDNVKIGQPFLDSLKINFQINHVYFPEGVSRKAYLNLSQGAYSFTKIERKEQAVNVKTVRSQLFKNIFNSLVAFYNYAKYGIHHLHQPINLPTAGAQVFLMD